MHVANIISIICVVQAQHLARSWTSSEKHTRENEINHLYLNHKLITGNQQQQH